MFELPVPVDSATANRETLVDDDFLPHFQTSVLLTIDMQCDFLSDRPYGVPGTTEILPAVAKLAAAYRSSGWPIVHVVRLYLQDGSNADLPRRRLLRSGAHLVLASSSGAELAPGLLRRGNRLDADLLLSGSLQTLDEQEFAMFKPRWNAFFRTQLAEWLTDRGVDTVTVAGCNFPNCPRGSLFGASERDFRAVAASDALSQWQTWHEGELRNLGIHTATVAEIVEQLVADTSGFAAGPASNIQEATARSGRRADAHLEGAP